MSDTRLKYVPPSIDQLAFNCPHCGALAKQFWHSVHTEKLDSDRTPTIVDEVSLARLENDTSLTRDEPEGLKEWAKRMAKGLPFLEPNSKYRDYDLRNVAIASCFNCKELSLWLHNRLVWPNGGEAPLPNADLSDEIRRDYEEASSILNLSPRGAAALLRLVVQKLCVELGEHGRNLDSDIASLVSKGLDPRVQMALDVVRVVGNNAVHPGQIDLRDDRATAEKLFGLVNLIAEIMITQPKHLKAMFESLPDGAKVAIERRDKAL